MQLKSENFESWEGKEIKMVLLSVQMVPTYFGIVNSVQHSMISFLTPIVYKIFLFLFLTRQLDSTY